MMYAPILSGVTTFLSLSIAIQAFTLPCIVGEQKCGFYLATVDGYNTTDFTAAVNLSSTIPLIQAAQLPQVLYNCEDVFGLIAGIQYCQAGCASIDNDTLNDFCV